MTIEEALNKAVILDDAYLSINNKIDGFVIYYGNMKFGYNFIDPAMLPKLWKYCITQSRYAFGDVYLYHNGNYIRAMHNANKKVTDKYIFGYYSVTKLKCNKLV